MEPIRLDLDLGEQAGGARRFARDNPGLVLAEFLRVYPAVFPGEEPTAEQLELPLSSFRLFPVRIDARERAARPANRGRGRAALDALWDAEQSTESTVGRRVVPGDFPETISDNEAVRTAYRLEMDAISDYLRNGQSVLVMADKILTEFVYETVCNQAGKRFVLDTTRAEGDRAGLGTRLEEAMEGGPQNPLANLPTLIHNSKPGEVVVLRSLDLLDVPALIEIVYQRSGKGEKPQLLAFLDPSIEVRKVLTDRFAVHVAMRGLPRYVSLDGVELVHTVTHLLTRPEFARFDEYLPEDLYKNVSGLNAIQFRNAMRYVGALLAPGSKAKDVHRIIRQFKTSSSEEIEIPDITFEDIGGYEKVKHQLKNIITLVAGPVQGLDEHQRGQLIPRGFIFHGPPGTGKTLFAKAIANEMNATIQMISGPEIMDKYVGQSENNLRRIFATARRNAPAVVFFDEFDSIASQRSTYSDGGARANNAVVAQFLTELDGFRHDQAVLVIGTTNRIDIIDEALIRPSRLRPIEIGLPDYVARASVARIHAQGFGVDAMLTGACDLALEHFAAWEASGAEDHERTVPPAFLEALFAVHAPSRARYEHEESQASFTRDVQAFFDFVRDCRNATGEVAERAGLAEVGERLRQIGARWGIDPEAGSAVATTPMQTAIHELFAVLAAQRRGGVGSSERIVSAVLELVAEFTEGFNNDEVRAVFQEASLEHHLEGHFITPAYLGQKIGLIRKRRDEREAVHLSGRRR